MNMLGLALFFSFIYVLYSLQQMKMTLKEKGYEVDILSNPINDHKNFKILIEKEKEASVKARYQGLLNGLYLALVGTAVISGYLIFGQR